MKIASQELMKKVYDRVVKRTASTYDSDFKKDYGRLAKTLPSMIQVSGLAQAINFHPGKLGDDKARRAILCDLSVVLGGTMLENDQATAVDLQKRIVGESNVMEYMTTTRRTLQALQSFKRFSASLLGADGTDEDEQ